MYCLLGTYQSLSLVVFNNFRENNISTVNQSFRFHDILLYCLSVFLLISLFCEAIDHGKDIRVIVCDISKAFDGVWHREYFTITSCWYSFKSTWLVWKKCVWHMTYFIIWPPGTCAVCYQKIIMLVILYVTPHISVICMTNIFYISYFPSTLRLWNELSESLRNTQSLDILNVCYWTTIRQPTYRPTTSP